MRDGISLLCNVNESPQLGRLHFYACQTKNITHHDQNSINFNNQCFERPSTHFTCLFCNMTLFSMVFNISENICDIQGFLTWQNKHFPKSYFEVSFSAEFFQNHSGTTRLTGFMMSLLKSLPDGNFHQLVLKHISNWVL